MYSKLITRKALCDSIFPLWVSFHGGTDCRCPQCSHATGTLGHVRRGRDKRHQCKLQHCLFPKAKAWGKQKGPHMYDPPTLPPTPRIQTTVLRMQHSVSSVVLLTCSVNVYILIRSCLV